MNRHPIPQCTKALNTCPSKSSIAAIFSGKQVQVTSLVLSSIGERRIAYDMHIQSISQIAQTNGQNITFLMRRKERKRFGHARSGDSAKEEGALIKCLSFEVSQPM
jgi:hypothetical protein